MKYIKDTVILNDPIVKKNANLKDGDQVNLGYIFKENNLPLGLIKVIYEKFKVSPINPMPDINYNDTSKFKNFIKYINSLGINVAIMRFTYSFKYVKSYIVESDEGTPIIVVYNSIKFNTEYLIIEIARQLKYFYKDFDLKKFLLGGQEGDILDLYKNLGWSLNNLINITGYTGNKDELFNKIKSNNIKKGDKYKVY